MQERMLTWTTVAADVTSGLEAVDFVELKRGHVGAARGVGLARTTLDNPAAVLLARFATRRPLAVVDVRLESPDDVEILLGYVVEPAWRAGCRLVVHADRPLRAHRLDDFVQPEFGYAYALERLRHRALEAWGATGPAPDPGPPRPGRSLDARQLEAVGSGDGVVQVIAPAGSGKTTVLIERVRELLRRGCAPGEILCLTFNAAAAAELRDRLRAAGVAGVEARTFHSLGHEILRDAGLLRERVGSLTLNEWRRLVFQARRQAGEDAEWIDTADAPKLISDCKLGLLLTDAEVNKRWKAGSDQQRTLAALYPLYEARLAERRWRDFDDLVFLAVRVLREDEGRRARWQERFTRVLVDEFQDIEPAQELMVRIVAAPQDSLLTVGDEDQTLYAWRRASVERIVALDQAFPALQRVALETNYRCPPEVVARSAQLIAVNARRFPKAIRAAPDHTGTEADVGISEHAGADAGARWSAERLRGNARGTIVVLARTTRLLRAVAEHCADIGVRISAPEAVFRENRARRVVGAWMRLLAEPREADAADVEEVVRHPPRGLVLEAPERIAQRLRDGAGWSAAVEGLAATERDRDRVRELIGVVARIEGQRHDAVAVVRQLRAGGLDRHLGQQERAFGGTEQVEIETLDDLEREARGRTVRQFATELTRRRAALADIRDDTHGIELATVHGAKGREWPVVLLFGCDAEQLPHRRSLDVEEEAIRRGEGMEAERRIAYVALTRAKERLQIVTTAGKESPFLLEAGLREPPPPPPRPRPRAPWAPRQPASAVRQRSPGIATSTAGPEWLERYRNEPSLVRLQLQRLHRVGARYAVDDAPTRPVALRLAALIVRDGLMVHSSTGARLTVLELMNSIDNMADTDALATLKHVGVEPDQLVRELSDDAGRRLADALLRLAAAARGGSQSRERRGS